MLRGDSRLYFECHITIEPVFDERLSEAKEVGIRSGFHIADLLMRKRAKDTEERSKNDTFMTARNVNYENLEARMMQCIRNLKAAGFKVWRYKIEDTLIDSKHEDELGLLADVGPGDN